MAATGEAQEHRILSFCSGSGMLDEGVAAVVHGARVVCFVERESYPAAVLLERMEEQALAPAPIWCGNLEQVDWSPWAGAVDWITAGFPCQPFSAAGKQKGLDDSRWLWEAIADAVEAVRPQYVFLENVDGLRKAGLARVVESLMALGYGVEWCSLRAADVGAPHCRRRILILAHAHGRGCEDEWFHGGLGQPRGDTHGRDGKGQSVADADGTGWEGHDLPCRVSTEVPTLSRDIPEDRRGPMAHPHGERRQQIPQGGTRGQGENAGGRPHEDYIPAGRRQDLGRLWGSLFPPGPRESDGWEVCMRWAPTLEPALCELADGMADVLEYHSEALHLSGNGVVPLQAAVALYGLAHRAGVLQEYL